MESLYFWTGIYEINFYDDGEYPYESHHAFIKMMDTLGIELDWKELCNQYTYAVFSKSAIDPDTDLLKCCGLPRELKTWQRDGFNCKREQPGFDILYYGSTLHPDCNLIIFPLVDAHDFDTCVFRLSVDAEKVVEISGMIDAFLAKTNLFGQPVQNYRTLDTAYYENEKGNWRIIN